MTKKTTVRSRESVVVLPHLLLLFLFLTTAGTMMRGSQAAEITVTREWQLLGENDTIPAGMHVRMDLSTGEKWVKQLDDNDETDDPDDDHDDNVNHNNVHNVHVTTTTTKSSASHSLTAVTVDPEGSVQPHETLVEHNRHNKNDANDIPQYSYDFETMHRTLSQLPDQELGKYGGLPELPSRSSDSKGTTALLTPHERELFEARMAEIWEKRQAELKEVQEQLLDVPELLKERMRGIKDYLKDPLGHLKSFNLDEDMEEGGDEHDNGAITNIISLLKDLEFQLIDLDNARDFHTLGGWECLVSLLSEDAHAQNQTLSLQSQSTKAKVRAVQAHAAWAIGTAVKNTGEFFPYAVEPVKVHNGSDMTTTALDMTIHVFCKEYNEDNNDEESGPIRTLLAKTIYAIGAMLRGNRMAQSRLVELQGGSCLGTKLHQLVDDNQDIKLVQRLLSLASDLITDIQLDGDTAAPDLNESIVHAFTSPEWCQSVSSVLTTETTLLPVRIQETVMEASRTMATHCSTTWKEKSEDHKAALRRFWKSWEENEEDFDIEHLNQLKKQVTQLRQVL